MNQKSAMAIAAHPDDIEFGMAGTMILLGEVGCTLHYLNIGNGSCGTAELDREQIIAIRRDEGKAAAAFIGAEFYESLVNDLEIYYEPDTLAKVAAAVRAAAPRILLVPALQDYMEDHQNASRLAVSAAFTRGMRNFDTTPQVPPIDSPMTVYHAQPHGNRDPLKHVVHPEIFVNIESTLTRKREMLACHKSQKEWLDRTQGMDSYVLTMEELGQEVGSLSGVFKVAEGWRRHLHYGFCSESDDPLSDALCDYVHQAKN
jgi:LmbE family N-acetylglucosaminyl deacetylase